MKSPEILKAHNGIRVVALPLKERKSVSMGIWVEIGARHESPRLSGVSHFLEHLVFKGTHTRTANQIKEAVEGTGGSLNAFTSEECTCFLAKAASRNFENVFDVLADMVSNASLKDADIQKERTVILEEIKMTQDQPSNLVEEVLSEILWPNHALGRSVAGTLETVGALSTNDIKNYRDNHYHSKNITVVAAGDIKPKTLLDAVNQRFAGQAKADTKKEDLFQRKEIKPIVKIHSKKTEQTHLSLGFPAFKKNHPDQYSLDLLSVILGGNMSSRLFNEVREERGLAYDIGSSLRRFDETGAFIVSAGVDPQKAQECVSIIMKELSKISKTLALEGELKRAKEFYLGQIDLSLESTMNQMLWAGESVLSENRVKTYDEIAKKVAKTTLADIKRVSSEIFKLSNAHLAIVGPLDPDKEKIFTKIIS